MAAELPTLAEISVGIVGGSGALGGAVARALLRGGDVAPERLWISNRGGRAAGFGDWPGVHVTTRNQDLADACQVVVLSVPPDRAADIAIAAPDCLIISVMAGITLSRLEGLTGGRRVVRAMSSRRPISASPILPGAPPPASVIRTGA